jgi:oligopeptide transport system substrate-binding protein
VQHLLKAALAALGLMVVGATAATELRRGNGIEPQTLDIHRAQGVPEQHILRELYEGLLAEGPDGALIPGVASRWTIDATRTVYRFELRPDARWSNGDPVTAADFVFAFQRAVAPATAAPFASTMFAIANAEAIATGRIEELDRLGVTADGARVLTIRLEQPTPYFLGQLALLTAYPLHRASMQASGEGWLAPGRLISNGAYTLREWRVQSHVLLQRNPYFHDAGQVAIERVYFIPTENDTTEFRQYRAGQIDITSSIPTDSLAWARENMPSEVRVTPTFGTGYLVCNLDRPSLRDVNVRRALSMVLDRDVIAGKVDRGSQLAASSFVPPTGKQYRPAQMTWLSSTPAQRVAAARALLQQAGYGPGNPLAVEILYRTDENVRRRLVAIAAMWKQLGVQTRLRNEEWKVYLSSRRQRDYDITVGSWVGEYDDPYAFLQTLRSTAGPHINYANYRNPRYDELLRRANAEADASRRLGLLAEAEAIAMAEQPVLPIYFLTARSMVKPHVSGFVGNPLNVHPTRWMRVTRARG